ncbi:MAG: phosphatase PAP2 family protein [Myxococcales bacterium]|nr:phosphatase PAP2 family protein [Myxococcales bacterium]
MLSGLPTLSVASALKRLALWLLCMLIILVCYGVGKLELLATPRALPLLALDEAIPFAPWTVLLYGTATWACLIAWLLVPSRRDAGRLLAAITISSVVCMIAFVVFPTTFPRALYPTPAGDAYWLRELAELRESDSPTNCLPSLHVALAWSIGLTAAAWMRRAWARAIPITWALLVTATTLTTKQHYVVDIPPGIFVGALAFVTARRLYPHERATPAWMRAPQLELRWPEHRERIARLRAKVEAHQWSLDEVAWPEGPLPPLDPTLVRLINELIYVEEIAGLNFQVLARASAQDDLRRLYELFAIEERRHADGLRQLLALHGAPLRSPGLGNTLVLREFETLDPQADGDVYLIAVATPVFETMLDAGTVPFLRDHPALESDWFRDFIQRITRDEAAHMAVNWALIREAGSRYGRLRGLRFLLNPSIYRGMIAVPFMSLDVYSLAHRLGYQFKTLLPSFAKLWRLHRRYRELAGFPLWTIFRLFVLCGALATLVCHVLQRGGLLFIRFWTGFTRITDALARALWGPRLLAELELPAAGSLEGRAPLPVARSG